MRFKTFRNKRFRSANLTQHESQQLLKLVNEFDDCFAQSTAELGKTHVTKMPIDLKEDQPITYRPIDYHIRNVLI